MKKQSGVNIDVYLARGQPKRFVDKTAENSGDKLKWWNVA